MFKRKIEKYLEEWKRDEHKMPLIIKGCFVPGNTCIVFDEIQECPRARTSLKFFKTDGRFDVICTGSLLGD